MEKARELLSAGDRETGSVSGLEVRPHYAGHASSFYEGLALRGIKVDNIQRGSLTCTFTVPPRLTGGDGNLTPGAIANLVDAVGSAAMIADGQHSKVSVDMSISYVAAARLHDVLEITAKVLGHKAGYYGTYVLFKNKATGEIVAEGRHSLFVETAEEQMEKARELLSAGDRETGSVSGLEVRPHHAGHASSFYEGLALRGIRVDNIQRGSLTCTFTVPPRLTGGDGNLTPGAIANLVDEVGAAATIADGQHSKVSVDMSISYMAAARLHDELEITAKILGHKAGYSGTYVLLKNKATGEIVAEGRHSLFGNLLSKI
ncbi:hypothetical protein J5N97_015078 [Dioscorea zingiberensis]|uniref:Acyl-coenzyme A thioesterase 13 n=1 Tax=Dioscorea zingiberensis TaxID=325984 RepID=A0A9D5CVE4_9LILI|nr:hypothetical protein J5N97_015078 [Dioscorea zingiberensis]